MSNETWAKQVAFERSMVGQHQPCDSCWMLPEVYDALAAERRATVERIRAALNPFYEGGLILWTTIDAVLDAEAAR